jgi:hypothetical protein
VQRVNPACNNYKRKKPELPVCVESSDFDAFALGRDLASSFPRRRVIHAEGIMKRLLILGLVAMLGGAVQAAADHPTGATTADIRQLQSEADSLDASMQALPDSHPRAAEFRRREGEIRDDLIWLRGQVRRHQRNESQGLGASQAEVSELRDSIVALRNDVDNALDRRASSWSGELNVPNGTEVAVRLDTSISSRTARREDRVDGTVIDSVRIDGRTAIPSGARVRGIVNNVEPAGRASSGGRIELAFDQLILPNGRRVDIRSSVASIDEGGFDKKRAGLGAVIGGILGGVLDGKKGALIGVLVGGGGAVVADKGREVELPAGTVVNLRLDRPVAVR